MTRVPQYYDWPLEHLIPKPGELEKVYSEGFPGCQLSAWSQQSLFEDGILQTFAQACPHLAGLHKRSDRRVVPLFLAREQCDPGAFGEESQTTGDCVSHGSRNARDTTRCVEIVIKGEPEIYHKRGATEPTYGYRGHGGQGMDPARATRFETEFGFLFREPYPELGINLSVYNSRTGSAWGRGGPPEKVRQKCQEHRVGKWIAPETGDEALDLLAAGYAAHSGQNVGFASTPNSSGIHPVRGRWAHDMATVGYDLSREAWPEDVVFVQNSWGDWNTQPACWPAKWPRMAGMITVRLEDWVGRMVEAGSMFFYADVVGVPAKELPDWGSHTYL